ncbi:MAG: N-acetylmuramoyl-L-alanine amidase family protein [Elusimicrobiales bacterium]
MKKLILIFCFLFAGIELSQAAVSKFKFFKRNSYKGSVSVYQIDERIYLGLKDMAKLMGAGLDIYQASGRIVFSYNGKKLLISKNNVSYSDLDTVKISNPFIIRATRYFILSDIFSSPSFTKTFDVRCDIIPEEKSIYLYDKVNITSVKYFYYVEKSRVVVYASEKLDYSLNMIGRTLVLTVKDGSYIATKDYITANDGIVNGVSIKQDKTSLKVIIELGPKYDSFSHFISSEPYKIIVDIKASDDNMPMRIEGYKKSSVTVSLPDSIDISSKDRYTVVIDPGHGGKDPGGKILFGKSEKQINLEIGKKLYELFLKDKRFDVKITRDVDTFIPLYERSRFANDVRCDIFISIHSNAHKSKSENGFEIYFLSEKATDPWASEVADYENASVEYEGGVFDYSGAALVLHSLARNEYINQASIMAGYISRFMEKKTPFKNRGIRQAAFYVLRGTYCPSILIEVGFMTNRQDKRNLDSSYVQKKVAQAIYDGVCDYIKNLR